MKIFEIIHKIGFFQIKIGAVKTEKVMKAIPFLKKLTKELLKQIKLLHLKNTIKLLSSTKKHTKKQKVEV